MLKVYNTLSRKKEQLIPIKAGEIGMYSCGPTVYNYAHIGNLRTYVFMDVLRRVLKYNGYKLHGVMNITDVGHLLSDADDGEDKMAKAAREQKKSPAEIARYYTEVFYRDLDKLNIDKPEIIAKATDHIGDMISDVKKLVDNGFAYELDDGIYYDVKKFPDYGKLSRLNLDEQIAGARVEVHTGKRNPQDFAVWKKAEPNHIMQWDSEWGKGYPGWHIECSTMSKKYLGEHFDLHTGGVDHIPIHHENEIAQNQALSGKKDVNYWMHGEFMLVDGGKMSKSLGNTYRIEQLEQMGYRPLAFRYFCLNAHYRKKLNFTFEGLKAAEVSYERLLNALYSHRIGRAHVSEKEIKEYVTQFERAVNDDINIPLALGVLWTMVKLPKSNDVYKAALAMDKILGLSLENAAPPKTQETLIPAEIDALAKERVTAKKNKNYARADELRAQIAESGYTLTDLAGGAYSLTANRKE